MIAWQEDVPPTQNNATRCDMNEELNYAEMLEIPVETVTVNKREKKHRYREPELSEQLVDQVNDRMEEAGDPLYAESKPIEREVKPRTGKEKRARRIIIGEFVAVCALCAAIFLTNIFMPESAINTFVRGLFGGKGSAAAETDTRAYSDFELTPVVNDYTDVEFAVSENGELTFTAPCTVYAPCNGTVASISGNETAGYTVEIKHSDSFHSVIAGLDSVCVDEGAAVYGNIAVGRTDGEGEVRVGFYSDGEILRCYSVDGNKLAWN